MTPTEPEIAAAAERLRVTRHQAGIPWCHDAYRSFNPNAPALQYQCDLITVADAYLAIKTLPRVQADGLILNEWYWVRFKWGSDDDWLPLQCDQYIGRISRGFTKWFHLGNCGDLTLVEFYGPIQKPELA